MTDRARKLFEDAMALSDDERLDLAEQLLSSLPADQEWLAELERRARRALADPQGGEAWDVVKRRLAAQVRASVRAIVEGLMPDPVLAPGDEIVMHENLCGGANSICD